MYTRIYQTVLDICSKTGYNIKLVVPTNKTDLPALLPMEDGKHGNQTSSIGKFILNRRKCCALAFG